MTITLITGANNGLGYETPSQSLFLGVRSRDGLGRHCWLSCWLSTRPSWHEVISGWPSRDKFDGHDRATVALDGSVVPDDEPGRHLRRRGRRLTTPPRRVGPFRGRPYRSRRNPGHLGRSPRRRSTRSALDAGTTGIPGGLLADGRSRVLDPWGEVIPRRLADGNGAASPTGLLNGGCTPGPAVTFGRLAGLVATQARHPDVSGDRASRLGHAARTPAHQVGDPQHFDAVERRDWVRVTATIVAQAFVDHGTPDVEDVDATRRFSRPASSGSPQCLRSSHAHIDRGDERGRDIDELRSNGPLPRGDRPRTGPDVGGPLRGRVAAMSRHRRMDDQPPGGSPASSRAGRPCAERRMIHRERKSLDY